MPEEFWIFMVLGLILFFAGLVTGRIERRVEGESYATLVVESLDKISQLEAEIESLQECNDREAVIIDRHKAENEALREQKPTVQISDGDVWLHFPGASLTIEGICKFGQPGPIVRRNLRKWRDALLAKED